MEYDWNDTFLALHSRCLEQYKRGSFSLDSFFTDEEHSFLRRIGCKPREFFDFVEDYGPDMSAATALLVAAQRRAYFAEVQGTKPSRLEIKPSELPSREASINGIPWLPRILVKARAKLRGELDPDIMYGCGGDRHFLSSYDISPADFLKVVWNAGDDDQRVADFVKSRKSRL